MHPNSYRQKWMNTLVAYLVVERGYLPSGSMPSVWYCPGPGTDYLIATSSGSTQTIDKGTAYLLGS